MAVDPHNIIEGSISASDTTSVFAVFAGMWLAISTSLSVIKAANERRDVVITGYYSGVPMDAEHRSLMLHNDWVPMAIIIAFICAMFSAACIALPFAFRLSTAISFVCFGAAVPPTIAFICYSIGAIFEYKAMRVAISQSPSALSLSTNDRENSTLGLPAALRIGQQNPHQQLSSRVE